MVACLCFCVWNVVWGRVRFTLEAGHSCCMSSGLRCWLRLRLLCPSLRPGCQSFRVNTRDFRRGTKRLVNIAKVFTELGNMATLTSWGDQRLMQQVKEWPELEVGKLEKTTDESRLIFRSLPFPPWWPHPSLMLQTGGLTKGRNDGWRILNCQSTWVRRKRWRRQRHLGLCCVLTQTLRFEKSSVWSGRHTVTLRLCKEFWGVCKVGFRCRWRGESSLGHQLCVWLRFMVQLWRSTQGADVPKTCPQGRLSFFFYT